jgi:hypothetical protein
MGTPWTRRTPQILERPAAALPQTADAALFRITGGKIRVVGIYGEVTTAIQNQANNTKIKLNPSGAGNDVDLCAVASVANDAVGTIYSMTGTAATAMQKSAAPWVLVPAAGVAAPGVILGPGDIELDCAASNTGAVKWTLVYELVDPGANVALAL